MSNNYRPCFNRREKLVKLCFVCKVSFKKSENYCIPRGHRLLGQTTKQPLRNFEPQQP